MTGRVPKTIRWTHLCRAGEMIGVKEESMSRKSAIDFKMRFIDPAIARGKMRQVAEGEYEIFEPPKESVTAARTEAPFTDTERLLLEWLSKEESSALGECFSASLWRLVGEQYAIVTPDFLNRGWQYARVFLTEKGWKKAKELTP